MFNVLLGNTGLRVSGVSLGTMTFNNDLGYKKSKDIFTSYVDLGGNFFDCANIYGGGVSENFLGQLVKGFRHDYVIATKYVYTPKTYGNMSIGAGRKAIKISVEASLKRLDTDYIDILYIHGFDPLTPYWETLQALNELIREGKVLYIAASNVPAWWLAQANMYAKLNNLSRFEGIQVLYNLIERSAEREILPYCDFEKTTLLSWSPLSGGILTNKYLEHKDAPGRLSKVAKDRLENPFIYNILNALSDIARKHNTSIAAISLAWQLVQGIIPIVGAKTGEQLKESLESLKVSLTDQDINELNQVSAIDAGIPLSYLQEDGGAQNVYRQTETPNPLLKYCHGGGFKIKSPL